MPAPLPASGRGQAHIGRRVHADHRHIWIVGQLNILLHIDGRRLRQLGMLDRLRLRRRDRVLRPLGQLALVGIDGAAVAAAAAAARHLVGLGRLVVAHIDVRRQQASASRSRRPSCPRKTAGSARIAMLTVDRDPDRPRVRLHRHPVGHRNRLSRSAPAAAA